MWLSRDPPAVLLENFSIFYSKGETRLDHAVVKDFQQNWYYFDKGAHVSTRSNIQQIQFKWT